MLQHHKFSFPEDDGSFFTPKVTTYSRDLQRLALLLGQKVTGLGHSQAHV